MKKKMFWQIDSKSNDELYDLIIKGNPDRMDLQPPWWGDTPMPEGKIQKIEYDLSVKNISSLPDVLWTGNTTEVYSTKMLSVLDSFNVRYEVFKTVFTDPRTSEKLEIPYVVFRLLEVEDAIDYEQTIVVEKVIGGFAIPGIKKLVIKEGVNKHFFRLNGFENLTIISDSLKKTLDANKITGLEYTREDDFQSAICLLL